MLSFDRTPPTQTSIEKDWAIFQKTETVEAKKSPGVSPRVKAAIALLLSI